MTIQGYHLLLDCRIDNEYVNLLTSRDFIYNQIEQLTELLNMTLIYPPIVSSFPFASNEINRIISALKKENISSNILDSVELYYNNKIENKSGISGVGILSESHIAIHSWPEENFISMDVFSCKHFDHEQAVDFICKEFFVEKYKCTFFERGNKDLE